MKTFLLAGMCLLALCGFAHANPTAHSEYTRLDNCKTLWHARNDERLPDSFNSICQGRNGMRVILEGGDARSWIGLLPSGVKYNEGKRLYANWGGFPQVTGKLLEWRYHGSKLVALIVRMEWNEQEDPNKVHSDLFVWRVDRGHLDEAYFIGKTSSNEEAHVMADGQ